MANNPLLDAADGLGHVAQVQARKEQRQNALWREKAVAEARGEWAQRMDEKQTQAEPGGPGFTQQVVENFQEWRNEQLDNAPNSRTRQELNADLERLKANLAGKAVRFEASAAANLQVANTRDTFDTNTNTIRANPTALGEVLAQNQRLIEQLDPLDAQQKRELETEQQERMYWAAVNGYMNKIETADDAREFLEELKTDKNSQQGLQPDTFNRALNAVNRMVGQLGAQDQQMFISGLDEQVRELKAGIDNGLTPEVVAENIDDPRKRKRWVTEIKHARTIMGDMQTVRAQSATEIRNQLAALQTDVETPGGFDADSEQFSSYVSAVKQRQKMIEADAAKYAIEISPQVRGAADRLNEDPNPSNVQQYVSAMTAEQERLTGGAPVNLLTAEHVASIAGELSQIEESPEGAQRAFETLARHADTWGKHWPTVQRQLQNEEVLSGPMAVAASLTDLADRSTGQTLVRALFTGKKEIKKNLDNPAIAADIEREVNTKLEDFQQTLIPQAGGMEQYSAYREAVSTLAFYYADTQGMGYEKAVERAAHQVVNKHYAMVGSYRVPATENVGAVIDGASRLQPSFDDPDLVSLVSIMGLSEDFAREQTLTYIRNEDQWVTSPDESGLTLAVPDTTGELVAVEVTDENGKVAPYSLTWDELAAKAKLVSPRASDQFGPGAARKPGDAWWN